MIIYSSKVSSSENEFIEFKMPTFYLESVMVLNLEAIISERNIDSKLEAYNKNKSKEDLFK